MIKIRKIKKNRESFKNMNNIKYIRPRFDKIKRKSFIVLTEDQRRKREGTADFNLMAINSFEGKNMISSTTQKPTTIPNPPSSSEQI